MALATVATTAPLASPAFARDDDRDRRVERRERGGADRPAHRTEAAAPQRRPSEPERRRDDERSRDRDAPRYEDRRRNYDDAPRPNYMRPNGDSGRRSGGAYLPDSYRGSVVEDYRRYRLRPPPQGYAWVRMGNGFALVSTADGRIFDRVD